MTLTKIKGRKQSDIEAIKKRNELIYKQYCDQLAKDPDQSDFAVARALEKANPEIKQRAYWEIFRAHGWRDKYFNRVTQMSAVKW